MPYTVAHLVVVLPAYSRRSMIRATPLVAAMLAAGAMAPDFPHFIDPFWPGFVEVANVTHLWWAVISINVLVCLGVGLIWCAVIQPALDVTFDSTARVPFKMSARPVLLGCIAAIVGGLTHVVWDSFTHRRGASVAMFPILASRPFGVPIYVILQHGSTVIGMTILAVALYQLVRRPSPETKQVAHGARRRIHCLIGVTVAGAAIGFGWGMIRLVMISGRVSAYGVLRMASVFPITGALVALIAWAATIKTRLAADDRAWLRR